MRICCLSDFHFDNNYFERFNDLFFYIRSKKPEVAFFSGDFGKFSDKKIVSLLFEIKKTIGVEFIFFVYGNHDFYLKDLEYSKKFLKNFEKEGLVFLNNEKSIIDNIRILGTTYWCSLNATKHSVQEKFNYLRKRIESQVITKNGKPLKEKGIFIENILSKNFLLKELKEPTDKKTIIMTHFPPIKDCFDPKFCNFKNVKTNFYLNNDFHFFNYDFNLWICGHVHYPKKFDFSKKTIIQNTIGTGYPKKINYDLCIYDL